MSPDGEWTSGSLVAAAEGFVTCPGEVCGTSQVGTLEGRTNRTQSARFSVSRAAQTGLITKARVRASSLTGEIRAAAQSYTRRP